MNLTPMRKNDDARLSQAKKERELAAYLRAKADQADKLAMALEASAAEDGMPGDAAMLEELAPTPIFKQSPSKIVGIASRQEEDAA